MFDTSWIGDLDAGSACEAILGTQHDLREAEWREIALAVHWAVLHGPETVEDGESRKPGRELLRRAGGDGTPFVTQFACGELAVLMGTGYVAADGLIRDALDLQHRHPLLWAALGDGHGRVWKARRIARMCREAGLDREQAWFVDTATTPYLDTLAWAALTRLVEAKIIEADPAAAEQRRLTAALERFVATGLTNEHGLKTLIAKAVAGEVIYFVATCDRIAQILALQGDTDGVDVRRSKAIGILANPAAALRLLEAYASGAPHPHDPDRTPVWNDEPDPDRDLDPEDPVAEIPAATPSAGTDTGPEPTGRRDPEVNRCTACGGPRIAADALRPRATLVVRVSELALISGAGVAACNQGVGPVTVQAVRELLGHHRVTVRPVLDLRDQVPVDAYEVPVAMRRALLAARPTSVFPYAATMEPSSVVDLDHSVPYLPPERGGPPGQTRIGNLGPLDRFGHRIKTFGRGWRMSEPDPGVYLWRTPHGYWFRVDNDGTHALGRDPDLARESGSTRQQAPRDDAGLGPPGAAA